MLDRKLYRDVLRMWAQVLAVALVMACGVATIIIAVGASRSLEETRAAFYDRYRFGNIFAGAVRAPLGLHDEIAAISGVNGLELRIVSPVLLDIDGMQEPGTAIAVSIPDSGEPSVNRLYLRTGRMPEPGRMGEIAVTEPFAKAHRMAPGTKFRTVMNGKHMVLTVAGIVLTPEYIYALGPGDMVPDQRRFGVFFMPRSALAGLFNMEGAFNDVSLRTVRGANPDTIIDSLDTLLKPYGGTGAYDRDGQISHQFLDGELQQLSAMSRVIPPIFLFVSAFLVNMVLTRLITLEREQIGLMKAVGYPDLAIAWHYAKFALAIAIVGIAVGAAAGTWLGRAMAALYSRFFSFPFLVFRQGFDLYVIASGVTAAAGLLGAARAISSVVALPAAVAMQPPAPPRYRRLFGRGSQAFKFFSQLTVIAFRHLVRWPVRSGLAVLGTSMSVAILVTAMFSFDSIDYMVDTVFFRAERQDATLSFDHDRAPEAVLAAARLPGVLRAEPYRTLPVVLRHGHREHLLVISSTARDAELTTLLDVDVNAVQAPDDGLLISNRVANLLQLRIGDEVEVELLSQNHRIAKATVTSIVESFVGLPVFMNAHALDRLAGNGPRISGVRVSLDGARLGALYSAVKQAPAIGSIALQGISRQKFRETIGENIGMMMTIYVGLAVIITFGVVYNSARIQLSEHARELASLRVLGFTKTEVSSVLLIELAVIVTLAQPLGWLLGYLFSWSVVTGFESDLFRIPFAINVSTFAVASLVVLAVAVLSALIVRRRVNEFNLVSVLKTRE
ncbi:MAG: ABC transporter permease [Rhizobiaceae bacterium]